MWGSARFKMAYEQINREYRKGDVERLMLLIILWSDSGQLTHNRSGHPILMCLANQSVQGKRSPYGKV
jgi:hypothetical protein